MEDNFSGKNKNTKQKKSRGAMLSSDKIERICRDGKRHSIREGLSHKNSNFKYVVLNNINSKYIKQKSRGYRKKSLNPPQGPTAGECQST